MAKRFSSALITGASSGLGAEFARKLAHHCERLVLVARRGDRLQILAEELTHSVPGLFVFPLVCDLSSAQDRGALIERIKTEGLSPDLLINNAGLGDYGEFAESQWEKIHSMLAVNIEALSHLTYAFLPSLKEKKGGIINLSSLATLLPIPDFAVYAASKSYVTSFSEALRLELKGAGVSVLAVCPGPVSTEFGQVARREDFSGDFFPARNAFYTSAETVVDEALSALRSGKPILFPGIKVKIVSRFIRLAPSFLIRWIMSFRPRRVFPK